MRLERHPTGRATPPYGAGSAATGLRSVFSFPSKMISGFGTEHSVEMQMSQAEIGFDHQLIFTCRANDSWDDLSDEC